MPVSSMPPTSFVPAATLTSAPSAAVRPGALGAAPLTAPAIDGWDGVRAPARAYPAPAWEEIRDGGRLGLFSQSGPAIERAQTELTRHGERVPNTGKLDHATRMALFRFQAAAGVPRTGILDAPTARALERPAVAPAPAATPNRPPAVVSAIEPQSAPPATHGAQNARLLAWYDRPEAYQDVRRTVGSTRNMCANFVTTALEKSGALTIPWSARLEGYDDDDGVPKSPRVWAPALARYLEEQSGWQRVRSWSEMKPGDLLFTRGAEGTYNHVMVLASWVDQAAGVARVIDNQGFEYERRLDTRSPVMYGLRSP